MTVVTTVTPMKRGLKEGTVSNLKTAAFSYNRYPDEKGTESLVPDAENPLLPTSSRVTTVTPMKRGLKVIRTRLAYRMHWGYNRYPDEKGTERERTVRNDKGR